MNSFEIRDSSLGRVVVAIALPPPFVIAYTTRDFDGALSGTGAEKVERFLNELTAADYRLATCRQVHGHLATPVFSTDDARCDVGECDALITASREVALGIKVADCLPVSLVFPEQHLIANIHAGWRGAANDIVSKTFEKLSTSFAASAENASAFLGPSIRQCCFEVGEEVIDAFTTGFGDVERFTDRSRGKRPFFDLAGMTSEVLQRNGIAAERIHDSGLCTRCDGSMFHSYRRDGLAAGRNLALVAQ